jgi:hypothetical protein
MNELPRLRDEAESTVELLLLEAGVSYRSSADARAKTLAALGLAGSAAVSAGAIGVATSSLLGKLGWAKLLVISSIGAGVVAPLGYVAWNRIHISKVAPSPVAVEVAQGPTLAPVSRIPAAPLAVAPAGPAVAVAKPEAKAASTTSALTAELGALDGARAQLASGNASGALAKLDEYARAYPHGRLVLEAEVLRIDALAKSGQSDAARKRAENFLRRHPNSVLASRVRGYLG